MNKSNLRKLYQEKRAALDEVSIEEMSLAIANRALELPIWEETYYHIFLSISEKKEVDTSFLLHVLHGRDKSIAVPKANFSTGEMQHYILQENTNLKISDYGIPEPLEGIEVGVAKLDVVFVPLLAFDETGHRIGYGKGFYDRFLSQCRAEIVFVGLSFFEVEKNTFPNENDIPLDFCVTPTKIYEF